MLSDPVSQRKASYWWFYVRPWSDDMTSVVTNAGNVKGADEKERLRRREQNRLRREREINATPHASNTLLCIRCSYASHLTIQIVCCKYPESKDCVCKSFLFISCAYA